MTIFLTIVSLLLISLGTALMFGAFIKSTSDDAKRTNN